MECILFLPEYDEHFKEWGWDYQVSKLEKSLKHFEERGLALDIGAHVGIWTYNLQNHFDEVIAFEPQSENFECFNKNVDATIHNVALGSHEGDVKLENPLEDNSGGWEVREGKGITLKTLDSFNLKPDFIKIDVQGYELEVLKGSIETLKHTQALIIEVMNNASGKMIHNKKIEPFMNDHGFVIAEKIRKDHVYVRNYDN